MTKCFIILVALSFALSCGINPATTNPTWVPNHFENPSVYAGYCASPRQSIDRQGSAVWENFWLRSWTNAYYLWYDEVADEDPNAYSTPDYFRLMKTTQTTASGRAKDRFHFTYPTSVWTAISQTGTPVGYGIAWSLVQAAPPRKVLVAYSQPNAPMSLSRGAEVLSIDGVDMVNGSNVATLNEGLYPANAGDVHHFVVKDTPSSLPHTVTLTAGAIASQPTPVVSTIGDVGYVLFTDHEANAETAMIAAINTLNQAGISDIILDLRYNGGGYLVVASQVSFMLAGQSRTAGKIFELQQYNNKLGSATPLGFVTTTYGFPSGAPRGQALPTLNFGRVYIISTSDTCSASESVINGLRGIGVDVFLIGSTTCGKPYGFFPRDNCGTTYFSIQLKGVNNAGFGDFADGFAPSNALTLGSVSVPGCGVEDDFGHDLGDPSEAMLAAAIEYRAHGTCPTFSATKTRRLDDKQTISKPAWMTTKVSQTPLFH